MKHGLSIALLLALANGAAAATLDSVVGAVDMFYGCIVFLMQLGFAMVEVGAVSGKNINNILIEGTLDILVCAIMFWAMGFAIAFGGGAPGSFIGGEGYWFGSCLDGFPETGYA